MLGRSFIVMLFICCASSHPLSAAEQVLVEAESFTNFGGWKLDTQFITEMGSPYLLAHGLGTPVSDAHTTVTVPRTGKYRVFVRTKDWVARWKAPGKPGRFQVLINGQALANDVGTQGATWSWQDAGVVEVDKPTIKLALHDMTGFDGRCDAILLSSDLTYQPPNSSDILAAYRRQLLDLPREPTVKDGYDLVVVGGGYAGMGAAISAARMGCRVALIQNRGVLGGNGSSEVRVWAKGNIRRGKFPRIGEIIEEFADHATKSPGTYEEFGDQRKEKIVRAEKNIDLFLHHHAYQVDVDGPRIQAIHAFDTRTSRRTQFVGKLYSDCTGHGTIGHLAQAAWDMTPQGRMGMSNMWAWTERQNPTEFPETPWALDLEMKDFPYPRDYHGQWFWESGFDKDAIGDAEGIRDWNLRAVYGAFNAMKNRDGRDKHQRAALTWIAYIGGPRESRRLLGDVILTEDDIVTKRDFPDGCVPSTWSIDLHYPKKQYALKFPENPFISIAKHGKGVDRAYGYPVPYRCFYSRNIENLFMAGRCISVTHEALGTVRVMKTCGMMGEVVGKAASICTKQTCTPREVYTHYLADLKALLELPGQARRPTVVDDIVMPAKLLPANAYGPPSGLDPEQLPGIIVDDRVAKRTGTWTEGNGLKGYVNYGYLYANGDSRASIQFQATVPKPGVYEVRIAYLSHANRGKQVPVLVEHGETRQEFRVNMKKPAPLEHGMYPLQKISLKRGEVVSITITASDAQGTVHADAIQLVPAP